MRLQFFLPLAAILTACGPLPVIEDGVTSADVRSDYPALVALSPAEEAQADEEDETSAELLSRAGRLRARAGNLRAPVMTQAERARLSQSGG